MAGEATPTAVRFAYYHLREPQNDRKTHFRMTIGDGVSINYDDGYLEISPHEPIVTSASQSRSSAETQARKFDWCTVRTTGFYI